MPQLSKMDAILEPTRKLLDQCEFNKLPIDEKCELVKNELLNHIYDVIREGKCKLPDLVKAQSILTRSIPNQRNKDPKTNTFTKTPLPKEPQDQ
jgi:hypothetical protein